MFSILGFQGFLSTEKTYDGKSEKKLTRAEKQELAKKVYVDEEWLSEAKKKPNIDACTEYLFYKFFTKDEAARHSLSGRTSHNKLNSSSSRPMCDQGKLERFRGKDTKI